MFRPQEKHQALPHHPPLIPRRVHRAMKITSQHLRRKRHHRVAQIDDHASAHRAYTHPVFRVQELDLQAAETVEEDIQATEVSAFAQSAPVRGLGGRSGVGADEAGVAACGFRLAVPGGEGGRGEAERCIEAGEERVKDFIVGGDGRGQRRPMGCDDRRGRERCGQSEEVVFGDL